MSEDKKDQKEMCGMEKKAMVVVSAISLEFKEMFSPRRNEEHEENPGKSSRSSFRRGELFLQLVGPLDETMVKAEKKTRIFFPTFSSPAVPPLYTFVRSAYHSAEFSYAYNQTAYCKA